MSLGLVGKHSKRRPVEPRRFDFIRWTVIPLLATARLSLAQADTGAGSYTDINAEHSYSGITGLLPKTFGEPAPAAETSVRFGAARALGVQFALSGIGPSFTELRWHAQSNFEMIKIERDIFELAPYERSRHFESIISMAHRLDAVVAVEGVETAVQHAAVRTTHAEFG